MLAATIVSKVMVRLTFQAFVAIWIFYFTAVRVANWLAFVINHLIVVRAFETFIALSIFLLAVLGVCVRPACFTIFNELKVWVALFTS